MGHVIPGQNNPLYREPTDDEVDLKKGDPTNWVWSTWVPTGSFKAVFVGSYDYWYFIRPRWPYGSSEGSARRLPPYFGVREPLPVLLAVIMGFQHAAAMVSGIVIGPLVLATKATDPKITQYLVGVCLIASGLGTIVHVIRIHIWRTKYYFGTGIVSVMGITTTQAVVGSTVIANDVAIGISWNDAYGKFLGTNLICCWVVVMVSFLPIRVQKALFPPWIAGLTVFLVGVTLTGVGIKNWGGGDVCAGDPTMPCTGNGDVELVYGSWSYLALGAVNFVCLFFFEIFGPPLIRNCEILLSLLIAYAVAAFVRYDGMKYVASGEISSSPNGTFFWVHTFKLGVYPGAILPFIIGYLADAATAVGDVVATEEASMLETHGKMHESRIQGLLLADGFSSFIAALCTSMPINVYAQNNGIISFTLCASRTAGVACGIWLVLMGCIGKIGAFFAYAPNCVIGGITTFLFGSIAVAGIKVMMDEHFLDRRTRFIMTVAASLGIGISISGDWATNNLWVISDHASSGIRALHDSVIIVLSTGYVLGWLVAMLLNLILPFEEDPISVLRARQHKLDGRSDSHADIKLQEGFHTRTGLPEGSNDNPAAHVKHGHQVIGDPDATTNHEQYDDKLQV